MARILARDVGQRDHRKVVPGCRQRLVPCPVGRARHRKILAGGRCGDCRGGGLRRRQTGCGLGRGGCGRRRQTGCGLGRGGCGRRRGSGGRRRGSGGRRRGGCGRRRGGCGRRRGSGGRSGTPSGRCVRGSSPTLPGPRSGGSPLSIDPGGDEVPAGLEVETDNRGSSGLEGGSRQAARHQGRIGLHERVEGGDSLLRDAPVPLDGQRRLFADLATHDVSQQHHGEGGQDLLLGND